MEDIKHEWVRHPDGRIDTFQLEYEYHNGPRCLRCGHMFCHWCDPDDYDKPCHEQTPNLF